MVKYCPICGVVIRKTSWGRDFCGNCGILEEPVIDTDDKEGIPNYVG